MRAGLAALAVALALAAPAAALDASQFRYERALETDGGLAAFDPDGAMFAHARAGFADLRILDADGGQVPWRLDTGGDADEPQAAEIVNRGTEGGAVVALLDFGPRRTVRDRIVLEIPDRPFVGRVEVFGSADRRRFTRLSSTAVYDVRGAEPARSTAAVFPPSDFRWYRIRATGVPGVDGATAASEPRGPRLVERDARTTVTQEDRATVVIADLGHRRVPVDEVHVTSATPAFDRPVEIAGSNDGETYVVAGGGRVFRFDGDDSQTAIPVATAHRYLRVRIDNGDDEPLRDLRVVLLADPRAVLVAPGHPRPYRVLYGAPLAAPDYDFAEQPAPTEEPARATLGPERRLAAAQDTRSFVERNDWLVQAALALVAVVLGGVAFLAFRRRATT